MKIIYSKQAKEQLTNIKDYIAKKSVTTAQEVESFINIINYLNYYNKPLSFHGWPISPDIAKYLLEKIEENNYDLIIELGSGTSTILFAEAMKIRETNNKKISKILLASGMQVQDQAEL